jgi:hypothetical protein
MLLSVQRHTHEVRTTYTGEFKPPPIYGPTLPAEPGLRQEPVCGDGPDFDVAGPLHSPLQTTGQPSTPHLFEVTSYT